MPTFEQLLTANRQYVDAGRHRPLPVEPARQLVVLSCMDSRIDAFAALGLDLGDAHVLRTAGARVTDDMLRSLTLSTHILGTRTVVVLGHTRCGLLDPEGTLLTRLADAMGRTPTQREWGEFTDPATAVRDDCQRLLSWPDRPEGFRVAGGVFDVDSGIINAVIELTAADAKSPA
ncbi:MAG: carbonic anhydrase [Nitriliruptoraceae bacterium]